MGSKKKKSKTKIREKSVNNNDDDGNIQDKRFQIAQTHPQFQKRHTKREKKNDVDGNLIVESVGADNHGLNDEVIDDRFKAVFTDSRFAMGGDIGVKEGGVDKYGRKKKKDKKKKEKKKESKCDVKEEEDDDSKKLEGIEKSTEANESDSESEDEDAEDMLNQDQESRIAYLTALSRGEIDCSSTDEDYSSEDEGGEKSSDDESSFGGEESIYGKAGILDPSNEEETEITYDKSKYLAACNMDWTNVRAVDLLSVVSSFSPPGSVKFVHVYPSDFGKERMEKDKMFGPVGVWKKAEDRDNHSEDENSNNGSIDDDSNSSVIDDEQSDKDGEDSNDEIDEKYNHFRSRSEKQESDFDAEKLRAYEAAKLKYYFAVIEFTSSDAADIAYKEIDGMEMGHSSATIDLRSIPESDVSDVIKGRECRDKASVLPSNYVPPDFVVSALQQTAVKCTWEEGDKERDRLLTQYGVGNDAWNAMSKGDDLKAYLASDDSSDDEESLDGEEHKKKGSNMRQLLGLDDSDDDQFGEKGEINDDDSFFGGGDDSDNSEHEDDEGTKSFTYIPGKQHLEDKIRTKLKEKKEPETKELTPWEKYQLKRKEKRKEKKRNAKKTKMKIQGKISQTSTDSEDDDNDNDNDDVGFDENRKKSQKKIPSSKQELDLLLAGDNGKIHVLKLDNLIKKYFD